MLQIDTGQKASAQNDRDRQQHRKLCSISTFIAHQACRRHGDARTAGAGNKGNDLCEADEQRPAPAHMFKPVDRHADLVGNPKDNAKDKRGPGNDFDRAQLFLDARDFEIEADRDHRDGGENDVQGESGTGIDPAGQKHEESADHRENIAPEIDHYSGQCADMNGNIYQQTLICSTSQGGGQDQVT